MNADIKNMLEFYKHKKLSVLETDNGELIPSKEAKKATNAPQKQHHHIFLLRRVFSIL